MQKMILPQELDVWYVLPAIRKEFALEMIKHGLNQKEVAKLLSLTEAAVSHYKNDNRAKEDLIDEKTKKEIKNSVETIIKNNNLLFHEIMRIDNMLKINGIFCKIHKSKSFTPDKCEMTCEKTFLRIGK